MENSGRMTSIEKAVLAAVFAVIALVAAILFVAAASLGAQKTATLAVYNTWPGFAAHIVCDGNDLTSVGRNRFVFIPVSVGNHVCHIGIRHHIKSPKWPRFTFTAVPGGTVLTRVDSQMFVGDFLIQVNKETWDHQTRKMKPGKLAK